VLRLNPTTLPPVALVHGVALVNTDAWEELSLTWNDRPGYGPLVATWEPQVAAAADVSAAARTATNGLLSLALMATNDPAANVLAYWSREGDANLGPRLHLVSTNGSVLSATQSFWVTVTAPVPLLPPRMSLLELSDGQFRFMVAGETAPHYAVQVSTNLTDWHTVYTTNAPLLPFSWSEVYQGDTACQFYRAVASP